MKKFTITFELESTITRTMEIEVTAKNESYAEKMIENRDPRLRDGYWEDADESKGYITIGDVSETEE